MSTDEVESQSLPTMAEFCLEVPLYRAIPFTEVNLGELNDLKNYDKHIDCYCLDCGQMSVFHSEPDPYDSHRFPYYNVPGRYILFENTFQCTRNDSHEMHFYFLIHNNTITKIGQYPSIADVVTIDIKKYRKVLGKDLYPEFSRAIGLTTHGIGIGAFVYLRRIFENLIEEVHQVQKSTEGWDENTYQRSRMEEKIELLKNSLPDFLVANKSLYSILSKGIHELQETECLKAFQTTRLGIELILDEKLEKLTRENKIKQASKDISSLTEEVNGK